MYRIVRGSTGGLPDVQAFLETLNTLDQHPLPAARALFNPEVDLVVARAPGRLDLMGGIADYSGSLVLQLPLREAALVALQKDPERMVRLVSLGSEDGQRAPDFALPLADLEPGGQPLEYPEARALFLREPARQWAAYVAGAFLVLRRECQVRFPGGARLLIDSAVPEGKGVSSSAALEVAAMQAIAAAFEVELSPRDLALLCQKVENLVVGAPCGVMDQMTAAAGQADRLLALLCQPAELQDPVELPPQVAVWGLDSGVRHSVSGADYGSVRVGAFMGYRMIAARASLRVESDSASQPLRITDPVWGGYLANVTPSRFAQSYARHLPEQLGGAAFLEQYQGTTDPITQVEPGRQYSVRQPTAHPIHEHFRVRAFAELLAGRTGERSLELLGELMYQSHASYSACGLGCEGTDLLVEQVRSAGPGQGLYGAKITGGGSGGTVAVLGRRGADPAVQAVAEEFARRTGHRPYLFRGSSDGATAAGTLLLRGQTS